MNNKVKAIINDAPDLVTSISARLEDVLRSEGISTGILEKFHDYWQAEADASRQLIEAFTHLNYGYLQADAIPVEVKRRHEIAREQVMLFEQEYELQTELQELEPGLL
jgi:hypothetical protein